MCILLAIILLLQYICLYFTLSFYESIHLKLSIYFLLRVEDYVQVYVYWRTKQWYTITNTKPINIAIILHYNFLILFQILFLWVCNITLSGSYPYSILQFMLTISKLRNTQCAMCLKMQGITGVRVYIS